MKPLKVLIAGTFNESEAYPNVKHRIRLIEQSGLYDVTRYHKHLNTRINYRSRLHHTLWLAKLAIDTAIKSISIVVFIARTRNVDVVYLPYPATLLLWTISLLPARYRSARLVVDLFISLYDTIIIDRQLFDKSGIVAYLLFNFEKRALNAASILVTDTPENADYYASLFSIERSVLTDIPLSIDNTLFTSHKETACTTKYQIADMSLPMSSNTSADRASVDINKAKAPPFRILYVGTLVPLHNIDLLCNLVCELDTAHPVEFTFVGNGQDAPVLKKLFDNQSNWASNVTCKWDDQWQDASRIKDYIHKTDLCIGLLGFHGKSQRVWPIKNYLYMACGKPLITARTPVSERLSQCGDDTAFITVNPENPKELYLAINKALNNPGFISRIADAAVQFHDKYHADEPVAVRLHETLVIPV